MTTKIYTGDDVVLIASCKYNDGSVVAIDAGATVTAGLVHVSTGAVVGPVVCDSAHAEADWTNGVVAAVFPAASTAAAGLGRTLLEIQIDDSGKATAQVGDIVMLEDNI